MNVCCTITMTISRNLLLLSNSTMNQTGYSYSINGLFYKSMCSFLEYAAEDICIFLRSKNVSEVLFVPYALNNQVQFGLRKML